MNTNREPWLAVSLSWLLPGIGHLYSGTYGRGIVFIIVSGFLYVLWIASSIFAQTSIIPSLLLYLINHIFFPVYASLDAFRITKKRNTDDFERERILSTDPWLAVFLSILLPGLGHFYIRRWIFGILFLSVFFMLWPVSTKIVFAFVGIFALRVIASIHVYIIWPIHLGKSKWSLAQYIIVFICICSFKIFLSPQVMNKFFLHSYGPLIGTSMSPTIPEGSYVIVDMFTYRFKEPVTGDIILFATQNIVSDNGPSPASKRIIAVAGETVQIKEDIIIVDGIKRSFNIPTSSKQVHPADIPIESAIYGKHYIKYGVEEPYYVPEGHYFVLGDNRQYSVDSRCYGTIPRENIIGRIVKICWPPRHIGNLQ